MASQITVIDSSFRQHKLKCSPSSSLIDLLTTLATKLNVDPSNYGFRYNKKVLDLSLPLRLANLPPGAKLEFVLQSRSPSAVTIALQLPPSELRPAEEARLTEKFANDSTLWFLLRRFESKSDARRARNFTARGVPQLTSNAGSGAGRLFYETPVLTLLHAGGGREIGSFLDLQKTLGQCGIRDGNFVIRLSFRATDKPLEQVIAEIEQYFNASSKSMEFVPETDEETGVPKEDAMQVDPAELTYQDELPTPESESIKDPAQDGSNELKPSRPMSVYLPPPPTRPLTANLPHNESDYDLSIHQAKQHVSLLSSASKPKRLPSDVEIAAREEVVKQKLHAVKEIEVKVRFPDLTSVVATFTVTDTASDLYRFVEDMLADPAVEWNLREQTSKGQHTVERDQKSLIRGLGFTGKVLVIFNWGNSVPADQRKARVLKQSVNSLGKEITALVPKVEEEAAKTEKLEKDEAAGGKGKKVDPEAKMKKWLKLGKK